ncbi:MAG: hypothetical protein HQ530_05710 [Parcubacteria group bacterium]|nr:hypothetical protein [Parcubacteria group bacterium]
MPAKDIGRQSGHGAPILTCLPAGRSGRTRTTPELDFHGGKIRRSFEVYQGDPKE